MRVTEHRIEKKCCPCCGLEQKATFPADIQAPTQYGEGFAAWTAYLHAYQMLPLKRMAQLFADLTTYRPSEATLLSLLQTMSRSLESVEQTIRSALFRKATVNVDETGCRIAGKNHWVHVVSNEHWTLLGAHQKRGSQAMDELGFLPFYSGTVVHDCLPAYFKDFYYFDHALCNAHLLRECQGIAEHDGHAWAKQMKELLQESWKLTQTARRDRRPLAAAILDEASKRYDDILERGKDEWANDAVRAKAGPRGRKIKSKAANLGERLKVHKASILRFLWDADIPFNHNQAERDLRMVKVKQKVSGAFRTFAGAKVFVRTRSVISTLLKQDQPVLASLVNAFRGHPILG
ncbi:UNVERIFIED_CONTAM: transposase [Paenibacillus sp. PvR008]